MKPGLDPLDWQLIAATQSGLPLVPQPYEAVGALVGISAQEVRDRLAALQERGVVRRIGAVLDLQALGYAADAMSVWDVDDARVDALGLQVARLPGVANCHRRTRQPPDWPYNLFVTQYARSRDELEQQAGAVAALLGADCGAHAILYRTQVLKRTGLRLAMP